MEKEIVWSAQARSSLEDIYLYLVDNFSIKIVDKFLDDVENKVNLIQKMPYLYPKINDFDNIYRCLINKHISLYYKVLELKIQIIVLIDNRQNPDKLGDILK